MTIPSPPNPDRRRLRKAVPEVQSVLYNGKLLELFFTQSLDGIFIMLIDRPVRWDETVDKDSVLEYVFEHQRMVKVNEVLLKQIEMTEEQFIGLRLQDYFKNDLIYGKKLVRELFDKGRIRIDSNGVKLTGREIWVEGDYICIYDDEGRIAGHFGIQRDITERRKALKEIEESESLYRLLADNATDLISRHTSDGVFLYVSPSCENLLGYSSTELIGSQVYNYYHPDDLSTIIGRHAEVLKKSESYTIRYRMRRKDGSYIWLETTNRTIRNAETGRISEIIAISRDISDRMLVEQKLRDSENLARTMLDATTDSAFLLNTRGVFLAVNSIGASRLSRKPEEIIGRHMSEVFPPSVFDFRNRILNSVISRRESIRVQDERQGLHFDTFYSPILNENGAVSMVAFFAQDITERVVYEQKLKLLEKVFENTLEGIMITDSEARILAINSSFQTITGYSSAEVLGKNPSLLRSDRHDAEFFRIMWDNLIRTGYWSGEIWNRRKSGEAYPEWLSISAVRDRQDQPVQYVAVFHDITEVKHKEEQIRIQAYYDALTGLPNRTLLKDRLTVALSHASRNNMKLAVIFIDLDNFKHINDSLGHQAGDQLLQAVADRLRQYTRREDTVSRLSGDEFLLVMTDIADDRFALLAVDRILEEFQKPFRIREHELLVTTSIGLAFYPDDSSEPDDLIRCADIAMYQAKKQGKNSFRLFTNEMNEKAVQRLSREVSLRKALENDEIKVFFQPRLTAASGEVSGMEALARWVRPDGETVNPGEFIPLAEDTGLILPLGERIIELACRAATRLQGPSCERLRLGVNLSPRQFSQKNLLESIRGILERSGFPASRLIVEITESTMMEDIVRTTNILHGLTELGASIAVDDFGTGHSSLNYLKRLPIHELKVDRSFVMDLESDPDDACIVKTIINMARGLRLNVTAEGVETRGQLDFLIACGCDEVQGYLFGRPMPPEEFLTFLRKT